MAHQILQLRLILYLLVANYCICVYSESVSTRIRDDVQKPIDDASEDDSSERQFISSLKKWILGRGEEKQMTKTKTKTKIKYLPIYVPYPVYSNSKEPSSNEFYGAHHQKEKQKLEEVQSTLQVPTKPRLPFPHSQNYELPFANQLYQMMNRRSHPFYFSPYGQQFTTPTKPDYSNPYYAHSLAGHGHSGYNYAYEDSYTPAVYDDEEPDDYDSVVVENPSLVTQPDTESQGDELVRKRKKYKKKHN